MKNNVALLHTGADGYGVYAKIPFSDGECIFDFPGDIVPYEVCRKKHIRLNEHFVLEVPERGGAESYINHSCEPNCYISFMDGWPTLTALRKIKPDEQLVINYNAVYEDVSPFDCHCQSIDCMGRIKGFKYLTLADKIFIKSDLSPYLREVFESEELP